MKKALFLDRDGVINIDKGYVYKIENIEFIEEIFNICKYYQKKGYLIIIITNQSGIARGYYTQEDFFRLMDWMKIELKKRGVFITDVFFCPHHPDENCECRKPKPGMILKAKEKYNLDLENSILIGDKNSDIEAGKQAGIKKLIKVNNDYNKNTL